MASKKLNFLVGAMALLTFSAATAQTGSVNVYRGSGYDVLDTALIPASRMDQQRDFLNRNYDYPAKPRNQWELGVSVGPLNVSGDVRSKSFYNRPIKGQALTGSNAWSVSLRKAWGYVISTRLQYTHGAAHGYNWQPSTGHYLQGTNPYEASYGLTSVYNAYRTQVRELSLQMVASLNNIKFHRARNKMSVHGLFGIGGMLYKTKNDMLNDAGNKYDFTDVDKLYDQLTTTNPAGWKNGYKSVRKDIENLLTDKFDGKFETDAERHDNRWYTGGYTFRPTANVGMGIQFRLGKRFSLGIEDRVIFTNDDLIDGSRWQESSITQDNKVVRSAMTRDFDNINHLGITLGVNLGGKSVAPLWWLNPMDFAYNELTNPRRLRVGGEVDNCATKDSDNDGVSDCFDKCNDTPLGVAVDTKGCCLDTDADGVCDYKDKQLITPTECQPVDADGIGKCPCPGPECGMKTGGGPRCGGMTDQNISFAPGATKLSGGAMSTLNSLASQLKANPNCNIIIAGNGEGKLEQQRSWMRANAVLNYMNSQGIDRDRFIFQFGQSGPGNSVDLKVAPEGMMGGSIPPPPHPNLK